MKGRTMHRWIKFALLPIAAFSSSMLDSTQMSQLNRYNHRQSVIFSDMTKLKRFAKIDQKRATSIARKECEPMEIKFVSLKRRGRLLYYEIFTDTGRIRVNALDGQLIQCEGDDS